MASEVRPMTADDVPAAVALAEKAGASSWSPEGRFGVMYERDGEMKGCIFAQAGERETVVGPIILSKDATPFVAAKLVKAMELALWALGITFYVFAVKKKHKRWIRRVRSMRIYEEIGRIGGAVVFARRLADVR